MPVIRNPFNEVTLELQSVIDSAEEALLVTGARGPVAATAAPAVATTPGGRAQLGGAVNASSIRRVMRRRLRLLSAQRYEGKGREGKGREGKVGGCDN